MKFRAKIPFAYDTHIFNPSDLEPHDLDNDELVQIWADADYCEIVGKSEKKEPSVKELIDSVEDIEVEVTETIEEQPKTEEKPEEVANEFDSMTYPQLKKAAKVAKIKGYQNMSKDALIEVLKGE